MKIPLITLKHHILFWLLILSQNMFCQLADFNFLVATTNETCSGNGSISMMVSETTPGATIIFTLYLYPDTTTPIAQTSANFFNNLNAGNYLVIATQSLGNSQNTQSRDATINNIQISLDFEISQSSEGNCDSATLRVNVLLGNAVSYEILSGPVTAPPQASNTFSNLLEGIYVIRVYDTCNNALTKTFILRLNNNDLILGPISLSTIFENCNEVAITNIITTENQGTLVFPISVNYTIYPPDGGTPINSSRIYDNGPEFELSVTQIVALYDEQVFDIEITVEDICGNIISRIEQIDPNPIVEMYTTDGDCGRNLNVDVTNFVPPYTMEFIQSPSEFNPQTYNPVYPGPFTTSNSVFGETNNGVPIGIYTVVITDACGRTGTDTYEELPIVPVVIASNNGCTKLQVKIPLSDILTAIFLEVPADYGEAPPIDITNFIMGGILVVRDLPPGDYLLKLTDDCENEYLVELTIPELTEEPLIIETTPNCAARTGTLTITSPTGEIETVSITEAPITFAEELPFDDSAQINNSGVFYVENLPEGTYTFEVTDDCENDYVFTQVIVAYNNPNTNYTLQRNCGSFNLGIVDADDIFWDQTYWFQKYNPASDSWGHPYTNSPYAEGEMPNSTNSVEIDNEETIYNIFLIGTFRIIKAYQPYDNTNASQRCYDIFVEFEVSSDLQIKDVYNLNCEGASGPSDILLDVIGVPPYNFSIVAPITFNNGTSNIFYNLNPGTYEFRVEDACGSIENIIVNTEDLLPVVNIFTPTDIVFCSEDVNNQATFDLSQQNSQILGNQNPENYTITYHANQGDSDSGANPLPESYINNANPQEIYARVIHNYLNVCYGTTSFQLIVGTPPLLDPDETIVICDGTPVTLSTNPGYDSYLWSTGETTTSISVTNAGTYTVTVSKNYSDFSCDAMQIFTLNGSGFATIENLTIVDWVTSNNAISVQVSGLGDYEYSLDGINYQIDPNFPNLETGEYTVYVRDINGCGVVTEQVYLLNYLKFFTPNGDGTNENWQILGAQFEPTLEVIIYDRYGKLLTNFNGNDRGWNGMYNGYNMPTNDYWFVVKRANGKIYKGHFTLKR